MTDKEKTVVVKDECGNIICTMTETEYKREQVIWQPLLNAMDEEILRMKEQLDDR